jgi:putative ABC transport system permease protein
MIENGIQKVGKNLIYIFPGRVGDDLSPAAERPVLKFDLDDAKAFRAGAFRAELASAEISWYLHCRFEATGRNVPVHGIEPQIKELRGVSLAAGRFISAEDEALERSVAIIGQTARTRMLGPRPAIGQHLSIAGRSFEIIGLLSPVGPQLSRDESLIDEQIWIPITTFRAVTGQKYIDRIIARPADRRYNNEVKREAHQILARRLHVSVHDQEAVFVVSLIDILVGFETMFAVLKFFMVVMATTTLFMGGVGVMNMMLVSVNERRHEIGLRLAVGARRLDVVTQFMVETLVITMFGGAVGLCFGVLSCAALGLIKGDLVPRPVIVPEVIFLAIGVTTLIGVLSGCIPAYRAAKVDPAETLRVE